MQNRSMKFVMAAARVYTFLFAVVVLASLFASGGAFLFPPAWYERLLPLLPGLALLAIGWAWLLHIRNGIERP